MDAEQWRDICEFPTYQISNFGFVRNKKTGRILKTHNRGKGYTVTTLMTRINNEATAVHLAVHRLVAEAFVANPDPLTKIWIDHIDHNRSNNRSDNLQWVNPKENAQKRLIMRNNTSGITGVYFNKPSGKWMSYIRDNGKMIYLGIFHTKQEAEFVRIGAAAELHGDFATANNTTDTDPLLLGTDPLLQTTSVTGNGIAMRGITTISFD